MRSDCLILLSFPQCQPARFQRVSFQKSHRDGYKVDGQDGRYSQGSSHPDGSGSEDPAMQKGWRGYAPRSNGSSLHNCYVAGKSQSDSLLFELYSVLMVTRRFLFPRQRDPRIPKTPMCHELAPQQMIVL